MSNVHNNIKRNNTTEINKLIVLFYLGETFGTSPSNENSAIKRNLAWVITSLSQKLNVAISKHALVSI